MAIAWIQGVLMYVEPTTHLRHRAEERERLMTHQRRHSELRSLHKRRTLSLWQSTRHRIDARREAAQFVRALREAEPRVRAELLIVAQRQG
jgi:hypothetical protein